MRHRAHVISKKVVVRKPTTFSTKEGLDESVRPFSNLLGRPVLTFNISLLGVSDPIHNGYTSNPSVKNVPLLRVVGAARGEAGSCFCFLVGVGCFLPPHLERFGDLPVETILTQGKGGETSTDLEAHLCSLCITLAFMDLPQNPTTFQHSFRRERSSLGQWVIKPTVGTQHIYIWSWSDSLHCAGLQGKHVPRQLSFAEL